MNNQWHKKEAPVQSIVGLWGGIASPALGGLEYAGDSQTTYVTAGTFQWAVPYEVTSVSVVVVGGGSGGTSSGGGGLAWINNHSVTYGQTITVKVGACGGLNPGPGAGQNPGGDSWFQTTSTVLGEGATNNQGGEGGSDGPGQGGGNGGYASGLGGGGAGGYNGNGGSRNHGSGHSAGQGGNGGGGGAGGYWGPGGGVGLYGEGPSGSGGHPHGVPGGVGSPGPSPYGGSGKNYGGGANFYGHGGGGAVRIIWPGNTRQYPNTNTQDV